MKTTAGLSDEDKIIAKIIFDAGVQAENQAWLEGKRCNQCGDAKEPDLMSLCNDCVNN